MCAKYIPQTTTLTVNKQRRTENKMYCKRKEILREVPGQKCSSRTSPEFDDKPPSMWVVCLDNMTSWPLSSPSFASMPVDRRRQTQQLLASFYQPCGRRTSLHPDHRRAGLPLSIKLWQQQVQCQQISKRFVCTYIDDVNDTCRISWSLVRACGVMMNTLGASR